MPKVFQSNEKGYIPKNLPPNIQTKSLLKKYMYTWVVFFLFQREIVCQSGWRTHSLKIHHWQVVKKFKNCKTLTGGGQILKIVSGILSNGVVEPTMAPTLFGLQLAVPRWYHHKEIKHKHKLNKNTNIQFQGGEYTFPLRHSWPLMLITSHSQFLIFFIMHIFIFQGGSDHNPDPWHDDHSDFSE